ncbi:helix-turn-helix domain-containing protein [Lentilactobacillus senioris]|uniref:helix-turn-helix domain-containing protein n=1 Tax=Lentilactobacillus senioris TaxID=931534 RepID=UPI003D280E09
MQVQRNIAKIREAKGVKQSAVASFLGYSSQKYHRIEKINKTISTDDLNNIALFLGVDINIFFDDKLTDSVIKNVGKEKQPS